MRFLPLLLLIVLLPAFAGANGKFIRGLVVEEDPAIPVQRAAIRFADGVQTLVVESTFVAEEAGEVAWVLPLPSVPTEIGVASPGLIETMALCFTVGVHQPIRGTTMGIEAFVFLLLLIAAVGFAFYPRLMEWVIIAVILGLLALISIPNFLEAGTRGLGPTSGGDGDRLLLERRIVGDYDVAVLSPKAAQEMADWLKENGFGALDAELHAAIGDHIREGWCFTAARLTGEAGTNSPHPLKVTFPTERAVYPMRLTGQGARKNTRVDLFVYGPGAASHGVMREVVCGSLGWEKETGPHGRRFRTIGNRDTGGRILTMHDGIIEFAGDAAVMTRLSHSFTPRQMQTGDLWLEFEEVAASFLRRRMVHPERNRPWMMARWLMASVGIGALAGSLFWRFKLRRWAIGTTLTGLLVGVIATGVVGMSEKYVAVLEYDLHTLDRGGPLNFAYHRIPSERLPEDHPPPQSVDEFMDLLLTQGSNAYTGGPIREIDSPGNFFRRAREGGERVIVGMSLIGEEWEYAMKEIREFFAERP